MSQTMFTELRSRSLRRRINFEEEVDVAAAGEDDKPLAGIADKQGTMPGGVTHGRAMAQQSPPVHHNRVKHFQRCKKTAEGGWTK